MVAILTLGLVSKQFWSWLDGEKFSSCYKLKFKNTNSTVEYEALLLEIVVAKEKGIRMLRVVGDAKLNIKQVINTFTLKNERLKHY